MKLGHYIVASIGLLLVLGVLVSGPGMSQGIASDIVGEDEQKKPKKNVILITVDALNPDHMGVYGYERNTTPNIDEFASEATVFNGTTSSGTSTYLSIPSMLSSLYPATDGVVKTAKRKKYHVKVNRKALLLDYFERQGYTTAGITAQPGIFNRSWTRKSFDYVFAWEGWINQCKGMIYVPRQYNIKFNPPPGCISGGGSGVTNYAIEFINATENRRFFLWLHYPGPHTPYTGTKYLGKKPPLEVPNGTFYVSTKLRKRNFSQEVVKNLINRYDGDVRRTDRYIGKLFTYLQENNLYSETIVILTADHGECLGKNHTWSHANLQNCSIKIPLVIRTPGDEPEYQVDLGSLVDIMPTLLDLMDMKIDRFTRGESLFKPGHRKYQYSEKAYPLLAKNRKITLSRLQYRIIDHGSRRDRDIIKHIRKTRYSPIGNYSTTNLSEQERKRLEKRLEKLGYIQ